ncbi:hypothetical protein PMZ80_003599 [Knufia obscura]|uniref:Pyruvate decarboxylase n=2 Tax=Knufia TaxID=430999 RepID=A0AAN8F1W5_9EURO|nr:hypothetical protein PMZ80_003599 [Knufia obscura]KAK5958486.1 hypothetical protein OHC33_000329 [Knufia fluminis]
MSEQIDLAEYLFTRLRQLGVESIHGVPGDYNLQALDYIEPAGINWAGNASELAAGYAADGYGRIKGISALVTAFGVGELSAINAVGGAYAEMSPVVHIVGTPPTALQDARMCLHHSLGDGNFRVFADMYAKLTVAQANLTDPNTAPSMIDRTLRESVLQSRPVYIELPTNMVKAKVSARSLQFPIDLSIPRNDEGFEDAEVELILARIYSSKQPFIIVDGFTSALGITKEADELVRVTGFPTSTTSFGKGIVNESYANFFGIYAGEAGKQVYRPWVESCDLILRIGSLYSDVNTYGFSTKTNPKHTIDFHRNSVEIGGTNSFNNAHVKPLLQKILSRLDKSKLPKYDPLPDLGNPRQLLEALPPTQPADTIDQATFWQRISTFLRSGDIILTETGTPSVGGRDFVLPPQTTLINSGIWLSIGYMLGAAQGAALAHRDIIRAITSSDHTKDAAGAHITDTPPSTRSSQHTFSGRTILFIGDGSLQMTAQSISDTIRNKLPLTIFIINNDGYTIERFIHGMKATYNDIQPWNYLLAPAYFGADLNDASYPIVTKRASNYGELWDVVGTKEVVEGKGLTLIEVMMEREDAPDALKKLVAGAARRNSGHAEQQQGDGEKSAVQENGDLAAVESGRRPSAEKMIKVAG